MLKFFKKHLSKPTATSCCMVNIQEVESEENHTCSEYEKLEDNEQTGDYLKEKSE
ncbi:hypothetical protein [Exiguobacterium sp.]|uniref:hypothetical protein n=1 Tax=Exiguobacterium sp. TaxID=44751 RepID=UPI00307D9540